MSENQESAIFSHLDLPVKQMIYPALIFLVIGMGVGVFMAFNSFVFPDYFSGEYIHFGRVRPVHVWSVLLLWLVSANMGLFYFFVPRLSGVPLWSEKLATVTNYLWWITLILGVFTFPLGTNWGWEYAEIPPLLFGILPIKIMLAVAWVLFSINLFATVAKRRFKKMYVALWYALGTLVWTTITFVMGNFFLDFIPGGISRVNMNFFYVHNLVGLVFTPMGLAIAYYFIPKIANTPLYSHKLSMVGFWSIALVYAWIGAHHIIHGPMSQWLQTTSIIFSIWLFIPVWTVITNFFGTLKGHWDLYTTSASIRFLMLGTFYYLLTCVQGPLQSLRNINEITSKTDWIIGHSHISLFGTFSFFAFAGVYYVIPVITKRALWSNKLADLHFSFNFWGSLIMFLSLSLGGYYQGIMWANWADGSTYAEFHNNLSQMPFLQTVAEMWSWWLIRAISGVIVLFGNLLFVWNIYNTILLKKEDKVRVVA